MGALLPCYDPLDMPESHARKPGLLASLVPIMALISLLSASVYLFDDGSSSGPNQIGLLLSAALAGLIGMHHGHSWAELEKGIQKGINLSMGAVLILLVVGSLIGTWISAGIVPTMIYYGLLVMNPGIFFAAAAVISALVSLATGSSWTTVSTIGIALIGIASALDLSLSVAAGAIISGAYFGDKLSPLSDTTNLAPAMAGTELFTHIQHMLWTTLPSITIALLVFGLIGFSGTTGPEPEEIQGFLQALENNFLVAWYLLIPPGVVFLCVLKKMPALPALLIGALLGGVFAMFFQQEALLRFVGEDGNSDLVRLFKGFWIALFDGFTAQTGHPAVDSLLTRGGMASMLNTMWLIISAMVFGGVMETTGKLGRLAEAILGFSHSTGSLVAATLATAIGMNIVASDQYIAIVVPGRMFRAEFQKRGLHPKNLSRCLEDAGTLTSPLVPWNTCGAFMSQNLGVATFAYLPFCFFNLLNPFISALYGFSKFTIEPLKTPPEKGAALAEG